MASGGKLRDSKGRSSWEVDAVGLGELFLMIIRAGSRVQGQLPEGVGQDWALGQDSDT